MYRSPNSSIFQKQNKTDISDNQQGVCFSGDSFSRCGYQIVDLEKKMDSFGGMDEVEDDIINELCRSGQRIDALVSKVRTFLKLEPNSKDRKSSSFTSYSHSPIQSQYKQSSTKINTSQINKPDPKGMRLKDRVEKALELQDPRAQNMPKQPKYIK